MREKRFLNFFQILFFKEKQKKIMKKIFTIIFSKFQNKRKSYFDHISYQDHYLNSP